MTTEWKDLPTFQEVAEAQAQGWEIQFFTSNEWWLWNMNVWYDTTPFRGRSRQPKMKKVKILAYMHIGTGDIVFRFEDYEMPNQWIRIQSEDKTLEIPE